MEPFQVVPWKLEDYPYLEFYGCNWNWSLGNAAVASTFIHSRIVNSMLLRNPMMLKCVACYFFIRNHFINNLVLDSLKLKKPLELHGKSYEI